MKDAILAALFLCMLGVWLAFVVSQADANQHCASPENAAKFLEDRYGEQVVADALNDKGDVVQVFSTLDGKTWTVVVIRDDGLACIAASGTKWRTKVVVNSDVQS